MARMMRQQWQPGPAPVSGEEDSARARRQRNLSFIDRLAAAGIRASVRACMHMVWTLVSVSIPFPGFLVQVFFILFLFCKNCALSVAL